MLNRLRALWKSLSLLQICLAGSALVHIGLFSFRLADPEGFNRVFQDTPLEVILVNAGSDARPDKAQALAQHNLAGGGEASDQRRATSPLPPSPHDEAGDALEQTTRAIEQMQEAQQQLLSQLRDELAALPPPQPNRPNESPQAQSLEEHRRQMTKQMAEIEKRIRAENARPKKRYLSPAVLKSADALYYSAFRTRVERAGTEHFPTASGHKLYGSLVMFVTLDRQGRVVGTEVGESSGNRQLDKRAVAIVAQAGPFEAVPNEVSAGHGLLVISSRFSFSREAGVQATALSGMPTASAP